MVRIDPVFKVFTFGAFSKCSFFVNLETIFIKLDAANNFVFPKFKILCVVTSADVSSVLAIPC